MITGLSRRSCDTPADRSNSKNVVGLNSIDAFGRLLQCLTSTCHCLSFLGEAMEKGLRDCCRSIRIGKILIKIKDESKTPVVKQLIKMYIV